jgi:hypothetical protein
MDERFRLGKRERVQPENLVAGDCNAPNVLTLGFKVALTAAN